ncbi:hypothetical protein F2Q68_00011212 [Brassica cretica]|uniref:Uncharacterized protein n=1 Tax=Brassica cretica TaxID=69181 RepID=A0A8S9KXK0_BRACR|nr:hypothetical protein F2Q68_00011212 [Brassica cretica]
MDWLVLKEDGGLALSARSQWCVVVVWSSHPCGFRVHLKVVAKLLWLSPTGLFCGLEACVENDHPSVRDSSWMVWQIVLCLLFQVRRLHWYALSSLIPLGLALNVSVESKLEAVIRD